MIANKRLLFVIDHRSVNSFAYVQMYLYFESGRKSEVITEIIFTNDRICISPPACFSCIVARILRVSHFINDDLERDVMDEDEG